MDMFTGLDDAAQGIPRLADIRAAFRLTGAQRDEAKWGLIFLSPWLIGFAFFYFAPMIVSFLFSLYDFTLSAPEEARFVGLDNWVRMLARDPNTWETLYVTFKFALISLPIGMVSAFLLAVLLNSKHLLGRNVLRTLFYAPTMVPLIAAINKLLPSRIWATAPRLPGSCSSLAWASPFYSSGPVAIGSITPGRANNGCGKKQELYRIRT